MMPGGTMSSTSASPPEIKSARFDSTTMSWLSSAATADVGSRHASTVANNNWYIDLRLLFISSPPRGIRPVLLRGHARWALPTHRVLSDGVEPNANAPAIMQQAARSRAGPPRYHRTARGNSDTEGI